MAIPLAAVAATFSLWWLSDRLIEIGPLDRATFGWAVVIPSWFATPFASALTWRGLAPRARTIAATTLGLIVGGAAAILIWQATAFPSCQFGPRQGPEAWIWPSLAIGAIVGGGLAISSTASVDKALAGRYRIALAAGAAIQAASTLGAILVFASAAMALPACALP